jgi:hypothetical protein
MRSERHPERRFNIRSWKGKQVDGMRSTSKVSERLRQDRQYQVTDGSEWQLLP